MNKEMSIFKRTFPPTLNPLLKPIVVISTLATSLFLAGCGESEDTTQEDVAVPVKVFDIVSSHTRQWRQFPAQLHAANNTDLAFRVNGELAKLPVRPGQTVKKGQLLAELDTKDFALRLEDRTARYNLAKLNFDRITSMHERNSASIAQLDQAKAELDIASTALEAAQNELTYTRVVAPYNGIVSKMMVENYQSIAAGRPFISLQSASELEVHIQVPDSVMALMDKDRNYQPDVTIDSDPDKRFKARYLEHNSQAEQTGGSFTVVLLMKKPSDMNILPGMAATVHADMNRVTKNQADTIIVPIEAVFSHEGSQLEGNQKQVWRIDPQAFTAELVNVTVGNIKDNGIEVTSGLSHGDRIIAAGVHKVTEGLKVRPWQNERGI